MIGLQRTGDPGRLSSLRPHLETLTNIDGSSDSEVSGFFLFPTIKPDFLFDQQYVNENLNLTYFERYKFFSGYSHFYGDLARFLRNNS